MDQVNVKTGSGIVYISVEKLHPHPDNPRKDVGDVSELAESIKVNGVLQNLTVVPITGNMTGNPTGAYTVVIGHRRLAAAKLAGLTEVPCVITRMTGIQQLRTMLTENMQRTDLTVYEQAQGFQMMLDLGDTVDEIAERSGFSKTTVRRRVKLLDLDKEKFRKAEKRGATLQDYIELDKIESTELKNEVLDTIGTANFRARLQKAIEDEKLRKRLAEWESVIKTFAVKIEQRGYVGDTEVAMDYVRNYGWWQPKDTTVEVPEDAGKVRYYYRVADKEIDLYCDHQEREETGGERKIREYRKAYTQKMAEIKEIAKRHYLLRQDFIRDFTAPRSHILDTCRLAVWELIGDNRWNRDRIDVETLCDLLDLDVDAENDEYATFREAVDEVVAECPEYALLVTAYASADYVDEGYWKSIWDTDHYEVLHAENSDLDRLYDFLETLGYEMSDDEKAMQDGTHEIFHTEDTGA